MSDFFAPPTGKLSIAMDKLRRDIQDIDSKIYRLGVDREAIEQKLTILQKQWDCSHKNRTRMLNQEQQYVWVCPDCTLVCE